MIFRKIRQAWRIKHSECPECKAQMEHGYMFNGQAQVVAALCPERHYIRTFEFDYDTGGVLIRPMWNGGQIIPIPEEFIKIVKGWN